MTRDFRGTGGFTLRAAALLVGAAALALAAWVWKGAKERPQAESGPRPAAMPTRLKPEDPSPADADREAPAVSEGYRREVERPKPVRDLAEAAAPQVEEGPAAQPPGGPASRRRDEKRTLPEIFRMPPDPAAPAPPPAVPPAERPRRDAPAPLAEGFAPFGRLLKCQLVDTLDSVTARTEPILALVTEDLDWNGSVIIPAGTEALSYAKPEPIIDAMGVGRLVDSGEWTLVLRGSAGRANGRELILKGRALDRREIAADGHGGAQSWGLDDGADGLVGYTLSTLDNEEIKLFAAAAVSGLAQGFSAVAERQETAAGVAGVLGATQIAPTLGNAATASIGAGAADVAGQMAARIRQEISRRGIYVRVPAGKQFYVFVEQTIDPRAAAVGLRLPGGRTIPR